MGSYQYKQRESYKKDEEISLFSFCQCMKSRKSERRVLGSQSSILKFSTVKLLQVNSTLLLKEEKFKATSIP